MKRNSKKIGKNTLYFDIYIELLCGLLSREDRENPALKNIIRFLIREAANCASELPCYDNKLGSKLTSAKAIEKIRAVTNNDFSGLVGDHVVPISVINKKLIELEQVNIELVKETIRVFALRAVITEEEDHRLRRYEFKNKMPDNWHGDLFARYVEAGIELVNVPYRTVLKEAKDGRL